MLSKKGIYIVASIGVATSLPRLYNAIEVIYRSIGTLFDPVITYTGFDSDMFRTNAYAAITDSVYMIIFILLGVFVLYLITFEKPMKHIWITHIALCVLSITYTLVQSIWLNEAYLVSSGNFLTMQLLSWVVHYGLIALMFVLWHKKLTTYATIVLFVLVGLQLYSVGMVIANIPSIQSFRLIGYLIGFITPLFTYLLFWNKMYQEHADKEVRGDEVYE